MTALVAPLSVEVTLPAEFLAAVPNVARAVNARTYVPILSNLYIGSDGKNLTIRATDLETTVEFSMPYACEAFETTVPAKDFAQTVKGASHVVLTVTDGIVTVSAGGMKSALFTLPAGDYPPAHGKQNVLARVVSSLSSFSAAFSQAASFASQEETRGKVLTGVLFEIGKPSAIVTGVGEGLTLTGGNGYKLGARFVSAEVESNETTGQVIVPPFAASVLSKIKPPKKTDPSVWVEVSQKVVQIHTLGYTITARRIDGQYPKVEQVVPPFSESYGTLTVNRTALEVALKGAARAAGDRAAMTKFASEDGSLTITAESDAGTFRSVLSVEGTTWGSGAAAFNAKMLLALLSSFDSETVTMNAEGPMKALRVTEGGKPASDFLALIMPLKP